MFQLFLCFSGKFDCQNLKSTQNTLCQTIVGSQVCDIMYLDITTLNNF